MNKLLVNCELLPFGDIPESHGNAHSGTQCVVQQTAQLRDFSTGSVISPEQFH